MQAVPLYHYPTGGLFQKKKKGGISGAKSIMYAILRRGNATLKHFHRYATAAGPFVELVSVKY